MKVLKGACLPGAVKASQFWSSPITIEACQPPAMSAATASPGCLWSTAASCPSEPPQTGLDRLLAAAFQGQKSNMSAAAPVQSRVKVQACVEPGTALQQQLENQAAQQQQQQQQQLGRSNLAQRPSRLQPGAPTAAAPGPTQCQPATQSAPHAGKGTATSKPKLMAAQAQGHAHEARPRAPITPSIAPAAQYKPAKAGPAKQTPKAPAAAAAAAAGGGKAAKAFEAAPRKRKAAEELNSAEVRTWELTACSSC